MQFEVLVEGKRKRTLSIELNFEEYVISFRSSFGTSHSSTSYRTNGLVTLKIEDIKGYGECGLPPKKPLCYESNIDDCKKLFELFSKKCIGKTIQFEKNNSKNTNSKILYNPFKQNADFFKGIYEKVEENDILIVICHLFEILDNLEVNSEKWTRAARSAIEAALLDAWGKATNKPVFELIGLDGSVEKPSFVTASLNDDIDEIVKMVRWESSFSKFFKVKLDGDVERGKSILQRLHKEFPPQANESNVLWSIDANAGWTAEVSRSYLKMLNSLPEIKKRIYMIEQPFPLEFEKVESKTIEEERKEWKQIRKEYNEHGMLIYADESISDANDVKIMAPYVDGVNIKLEKAGGIRSALIAIECAKKNNLKVWIGMMMSSVLGTNTAAHLIFASDLGGDLDGGLWVNEQSEKFRGGFQWHQPGVIRFASSSIGIGVDFKSN